MIEITTKLTHPLDSQNDFRIVIPESFLFDLKYYIKILIVTKSSEINDVHIDSMLEIKEVSENSATIYKKKFYNELKDNFLRKKAHNSTLNLENESRSDLCILILDIFNPKTDFYLFYLEISYLDNLLIESLKTTKDNIDQLIYIGELYLQGSFRPVIAEIGKFGEYLTKQFLKKLKKKFSTFKSGVDCLANYKPKGKTKINYNYIGNLLYSIYYFRNQASHPEPEISLGQKIAKVCIENLSCILHYISENQIKF